MRSRHCDAGGKSGWHARSALVVVCARQHRSETAAGRRRTVGAGEAAEEGASVVQ